MATVPAPPNNLSAEAAQFWTDTVENFDLEPHHLHLLRGCCECLTRAQQARDELAENGGLTVLDAKGNSRPHPSIVTERMALVAFARLLRELDLDGGPAKGSRPPALARNRR